MQANMEIERKFIVKYPVPPFVLDLVNTKIVQGYLNRHNPTIRVRIENDSKAILAIKSPPLDKEGRIRKEYEYEIPVEEANELIKSYCGINVIEKTRYIFCNEGKIWEIDIFGGKLTNLVLAEIELDIAEEDFTKPDWIGKEVTNDPIYTNACLAYA